MRILCLHGAGTSAKNHLRDDSIAFEFIDGEWDAPPAPGIAKLYPGPYHAFYDWNPAEPSPPCESLAESYDYLTEVLEAKAFDGIVGFSQGAALAASYLLYHQNQDRQLLQPVVRFAVFMCGTLPWDASGTRRLGLAELASSDSTPRAINIPTLHVHGAMDEWLDESRALKELCKPAEAVVWQHGLGHAIPVDRKSTERLADLFREVIRRAIFKQ
ncbi:ef-hand calcium-binding domain protein [Grosmannia clavigera kw1407]|uniref:Ef-hand calcium-binding domain protein n=1 Tax=Grosmannia clavigera (strain kw1407 / UAMH 11150) TaxID=655863 RepID=F0XUJ2_GROCL|nr:ef-hand calcium-binding domain protein [Grosmannia clavigera kw1407]EFW98510.1 ef-hand calcium-binding domain protein [Grosmannia clavigera kw1407]